MKQNLFAAFGLVLASASLAFPQALVPLNSTPSRIVGHPQAEQLSILSSAPNLVEGRELWGPNGVALDTSITPNILYVSDTFNNRVLAWKDASGFANGQKADLVIGQQDFFRTFPQGPGAQFQTGLNSPTGLAVDSNGNLYVVDSGNNRVLRFPKPFAAQGNVFPDLYIGQPNLSSRAANYTGAISAQGVALSPGSSTYRANIAFDSAGNLWLTDPGNRRVLRFRGSDVASGGGGLQADLVIGQVDFSSLQTAVTSSTQTVLNAFATPSAIAFDANGNLYVSDAGGSGAAAFSRVLVFRPPFSTGMTALRAMGVFQGSPQQPTLDQAQKSEFGEAEGIFFAAGKIGIVDDALNRILLFDTIDKWPSDVRIPPQATAVIGQPNFSTFSPNSGTSFNPAAGPGKLSQPVTAAFSGTDLYVADAGNNRVLDLPLAGSTFGPAARVLGQDRFDMRAPNLIEGREFDFLGSTSSDAGVALDTGADTPHLYVADTYNNRVLGFRDFRSVKYGAKADIVIGQLDFNSGLCNQNGNPDAPTQSSLCVPTGLAVDAAGNLYVADTGNSRVLRFPAPFNNSTQQADLVLGQSNFTSKITDPSASTMSQPYGLAISDGNGLLVSDTKHNRVLFFAFTGNDTFRGGIDNGIAATKVLGQPNFITASSGNTDDKLSAPHHIATDSEARPYVADTANNRVVIFDQIMSPNTATMGAHAALTIPGLNSPRGVFVNQATGELWVGDNTSTVKKYPKFETLVFNQSSTGSVSTPATVLAVVQDQYGDLALADASNRVAIYYPGLQAINGANFLTNRQLAPGMFASLCSPGSNCDPNSRLSIFGPATEANTSLPLATTLGDMQVLVNGKPAPLTYVSPSQINFVVPMDQSLTSGTADLQVVQASTGRVYASGTPQMNAYSPGIFMLDFSGRNRQAAVLNQDNTVNSATNCAPRGSYIQIFATGQGFLNNAPPDGSAPTGLVSTPFTPHINVGGQFLEEYSRNSSEPAQGHEIYFSGLSPQFPGIWQINAYIPKAVAPASQTPVAIFINSLSSVDFTNSGYVTTICVK